MLTGEPSVIYGGGVHADHRNITVSSCERTDDIDPGDNGR